MCVNVCVCVTSVCMHDSVCNTLCGVGENEGAQKNKNKTKEVVNGLAWQLGTMFMPDCIQQAHLCDVQ